MDSRVRNDARWKLRVFQHADKMKMFGEHVELNARNVPGGFCRNPLDARTTAPSDPRDGVSEVKWHY